jgi:hypothetical protein
MSDIDEGLSGALGDDYASWLEDAPMKLPAWLSHPEDRSFRRIRSFFPDGIVHLWIKDAIGRDSFKSRLASRLVPQRLHRFYPHEPLFPGSLSFIWERFCRWDKAHRETELVQSWKQVAQQPFVREFGEFTSFAFTFTLQVLIIGLCTFPTSKIVLT